MKLQACQTTENLGKTSMRHIVHNCLNKIRQESLPHKHTAYLPTSEMFKRKTKADSSSRALVELSPWHMAESPVACNSVARF